MNIYIALLRGINIAGKNRLPMKELVALLEGLGCKDITTYIQSGNVVFHSDSKGNGNLSNSISRKIVETYGFEPKVILLDRAELENAVARNPFETTNGKALHLFFLASKPASPDIVRLDTIKSPSEQFKLNDSVFYLFTPDGLAGSKLPANVEKCLGVAATGRNWNTVSRLLEMVNAI